MTRKLVKTEDAAEEVDENENEDDPEKFHGFGITRAIGKGMIRA